MLQPETTFARKLLAWYDRNRRDLPWRMKPTAYAILVSELMLQQTQVATVIPYFHAFMSRYPAVADLANANEQEVLRLWQGLGYYSRARNLHAAAKQIVSEHSGEVPQSLDALLNLPGVGRYTAGALASIAFDQKAPILDGNVARVLCRLDKIQTDPRKPKIVQQLWKRAAQILPDKRVGDFNSALMELGATICTPRSPSCPVCPVRSLCESFAAGLQEKIPLRRRSKPTPLHKRWTICIEHNDRYLIEQRRQGSMGGLWQFVTLDAEGDHPTTLLIQNRLGLSVKPLKKLGEIAHALTHRRYIFEIFRTSCEEDISVMTRRWVTLDQLDKYPLPTPHTKVAELLR